MHARGAVRVRGTAHGPRDLGQGRCEGDGLDAPAETPRWVLLALYGRAAVSDRRAKPKHSGNCVRDAVVYGCRKCGRGNFCDVCHDHDAPRGECRKCPDACPACEREEKTKP